MKRLVIGGAVAALLAGGVGLSAAGEPGPNGHNNHGLCTAYFAGSDNGQEHKHKAGPFVALEAAAENADQTVEEYCAPFLAGNGQDNGNNGNPSPGGKTRG